MVKPYMENSTLYLSKPYKFGSLEISELNFGEVTAQEMGEIPMGDKLKYKDYYPIVCMLTGMTPAFINKLLKVDISKAVEHTAFLLAG